MPEATHKRKHLLGITFSEGESMMIISGTMAECSRYGTGAILRACALVSIRRQRDRDLAGNGVGL